MPESREDEPSGLDSAPVFNADTQPLPPEKNLPPAAGAGTSSDQDLPKAFGRYRVVSRLGQGGFGAVYRAVDEQLQRDVAVKVTLSSPNLLSPDPASEEAKRGGWGLPVADQSCAPPTRGRRRRSEEGGGCR